MRYVALALTAFVLTACASKLPDVPEGSVSTLSSAPVAYLPAGSATARASAAMVIDVRSGKVLYEQNAEELRYPASLTKMMTLYILFEELKARRLLPDTQLVVTRNAASKPPSKIGVRAGSTIAVQDAMQALAVKSANDVATVVAENISGTEKAFAARMTRTARALGMTRTQFVNASGLPDKQQVTTARDMAILGRALKLRHPRYSRYFSAQEFTYGNRRFRATNKLLGTVRGVDGIKTGYIRLSGYNLVASARRNGRSIIAVVIGGRSGRSRDAQVTTLLERYL